MLPACLSDLIAKWRVVYDVGARQVVPNVVARAFL
jgi:hypothetical protein